MNIDEKEAQELVAALKETLAKFNQLLDRIMGIPPSGPTPNPPVT